MPFKSCRDGLVLRRRLAEALREHMPAEIEKCLQRTPQVRLGRRRRLRIGRERFQRLERQSADSAEHPIDPVEPIGDDGRVQS